jgi:hypothetical protein
MAFRRSAVRLRSAPLFGWLGRWPRANAAAAREASGPDAWTPRSALEVTPEVVTTQVMHQTNLDFAVEQCTVRLLKTVAKHRPIGAWDEAIQNVGSSAGEPVAVTQGRQRARLLIQSWSPAGAPSRLRQGVV